MKKVILGLVLIAFVAANSFAASRKRHSEESTVSSNGKIKYGVLLGYGFTNITGDAISPNGTSVTEITGGTTSSSSVTGVDLSLDWKGKTGVVGGLYMEIPAGKNFKIQPELLYVQKGSKPTVEGTDLWKSYWNPTVMPSSIIPGLLDAADATANLTLSTSYIEVPVLFKATLKPDDAKVVPCIFAGPVLDMLVSSNLSLGEVASYNAKDWVKSMDFGLTFGAGVKVKNVSFDVRYDLGLTNIFDKSGKAENVNQQVADKMFATGEKVVVVLPTLSFKNGGLMATVGYAFN